MLIFLQMLNSFCDSFVECMSPTSQDVITSSPHEVVDVAKVESLIPEVSVSPVKLRMSRGSKPTTARKPPRGHQTQTNPVEEFFTISRPLSPHRDCVRPSPRHIVLVKKIQK